ncbi:MAG: XdhC family aldehyde oxidoreductase maturation factor [Thermodesulfobacteriota bacterium]
MLEFLRTVHDELAAGGKLCLATIISQRGSAPRSLGTRFFVRPDGSFWGTIGGGRFEADVIEAARGALAQGQALNLSFRLQGRDAADSEMICGGTMDVYLEPLTAGDPTAAEIFAQAAKVAARGGRALLATWVAPGPVNGTAGRKLLLVQGGASLGSLAGPPDLRGRLDAFLEQARPQEPPRLLDLSPSPGAGLVFLDPILSSPVVYIFGGGHVAQKLAPLVRLAGFRLVVADDRPEWANRERFPQAEQIWNRGLSQVLAGEELGSEAYLVIVTRGHLYDKEVLAQCLRQPAAYVGMIGSRRKRELIYQALLQEGFRQEQLDWVHSPIGLDIGAETPEEIAIAIAAELVAVRARRGGGRRKAKELKGAVPCA